MKDIRQFTITVLDDITRRLGGKAYKKVMLREMVSLESMLKKGGNVNVNPAAVVGSSEERHIYTERDIENIGDTEELILNKGDIITPLAKDTLKKKRIKLVIR